MKVRRRHFLPVVVLACLVSYTSQGYAEDLPRLLDGSSLESVIGPVNIPLQQVINKHQVRTTGKNTPRSTQLRFALLALQQSPTLLSAQDQKSMKGFSVAGPGKTDPGMQAMTEILKTMCRALEEQDATGTANAYLLAGYQERAAAAEESAKEQYFQRQIDALSSSGRQVFDRMLDGIDASVRSMDLDFQGIAVEAPDFLLGQYRKTCPQILNYTDSPQSIIEVLTAPEIE